MSSTELALIWLTSVIISVVGGGIWGDWSRVVMPCPTLWSTVWRAATR